MAHDCSDIQSSKARYALDIEVADALSISEQVELQRKPVFGPGAERVAINAVAVSRDEQPA